MSSSALLRFESVVFPDFSQLNCPRMFMTSLLFLFQERILRHWQIVSRCRRDWPWFPCAEISPLGLAWSLCQLSSCPPSFFRQKGFCDQSMVTFLHGPPPADFPPFCTFFFFAGLISLKIRPLRLTPTSRSWFLLSSSS